MILRDYQEAAIEDVVDNILKVTESYNIVTPQVLLTAPTGAGKTVMGGQILKNLKDEMGSLGRKIAFIWICIGKGELHLQSMRSIESRVTELNYYSRDDIASGVLQQLTHGDILFLSWDQVTTKNSSTGKWANIIMREDEAFNLQNVIEESKRVGTEIMVIIDESHSSADTSRAKEVLEIINPIVQLGITATPSVTQLKSAKAVVEVPVEEVIKSGMIKSSIEINKGIKGTDIITALLGAALKQKTLLKKYYEVNKSITNPLVLVQIPNSEQGDKVLDEVTEYLEKQQITVENKRLALWFTSTKENLEDIARLDGTQDVLIFKTSIDTGWDCPRAQLLVKFRDMKSEAFKKQVVGRILRMPEQKHYRRAELNTAYIYTDEQEFKLDDETVLEKMEVLDNKVYIRDEHMMFASMWSIPSFKLRNNIKPYLNVDNLLDSFVQIFESSKPDMWASMAEGTGLTQVSILGNTKIDVSDMMIGNAERIILDMSSPMLKSTVFKHIKRAINGNRNAELIMEAIIALKDQGVKAKEYYRMLACNALRIESILQELNKANFCYPAIGDSDIESFWFNMPPSTSIPETKTVDVDEEYHKCVYNSYQTTNYLPLKMLLKRTDSDARVKFWYPNYQYNRNTDFQMRFPCIGEEFRYLVPEIIVRNVDNTTDVVFIYNTEEEYNEILNNKYLNNLNIPGLNVVCYYSQDLMSDTESSEYEDYVQQDLTKSEVSQPIGFGQLSSRM